MMELDRKPLTWGLRESQIRKHFPNVIVRENYLVFGSLDVQNFPNDCGSLIIAHANYATKQNLKDAVKFASMSGFSKIFATVVADINSAYSTTAKNAIAAFKSQRFICVNHGKSNRNPHKDDFVFVKIIRNPIHKGY